jgi:hypothetical protein
MLNAENRIFPKRRSAFATPNVTAPAAPFALHRHETVRAAKKAGAIIHGSPSARTTVVVRGRPNPLQAAGREGGLKLMEIKRLREKGYRITLLHESQFWRLAGSAQLHNSRSRARV